MGIWSNYNVTLEFTAPLAASIPKTPDEVRAMLENRKPSEAAFAKMENPAAVPELAEQVEEEVGASEEAQRGWSTFKRDGQGIYFEARAVRAHIKDCSQILGQGTIDVRSLKSKVANRVYVQPERLRLYGAKGELITTPDGTETRMIHVLTRQGPRNDVKYIDYVSPPSIMRFQLQVLNDGVVTEDILKAIFEYGGIHGMGQERSQQFGQYKVRSLERE